MLAACKYDCEMTGCQSTGARRQAASHTHTQTDTQPASQMLTRRHNTSGLHDIGWTVCLVFAYGLRCQKLGIGTISSSTS
eukprot:COSAG02_NODE_44208_length_368_cov_0.728625_2_plen_79_part_01